MGLYDVIKDLANLVQKADNIELYRQLLDLSGGVLDMQNKIVVLTNENLELKKNKEIESTIERHNETFITLIDNNDSVYYCSRCWDSDKKLIQLKCDSSTGMFKCIHCSNEGRYLITPEYEMYLEDKFLNGGS